MNQLIDDLERSVAELKLGYFVRIVKRADRLKVIQSENRLVGSAGNRQGVPNELRIFAMPKALAEIGTGVSSSYRLQRIRNLVHVGRESNDQRAPAKFFLIVPGPPIGGSNDRLNAVVRKHCRPSWWMIAILRPRIRRLFRQVLTAGQRDRQARQYLLRKPRRPWDSLPGAQA